MPYQEKDFQTDFSKWCKHLLHKQTAAFELKITKTKRLPFSAVKEHQVLALYHAHHSHLIYKIPDSGWQNPFDSFMLHEVPAFVVIMFRAKNPEGEFVIISIDDWMRVKADAREKSLTEEKAKQIGKVCNLKNPLQL